MAEWLGEGLQNLLQRFESVSGVQNQTERKSGLIFLKSTDLLESRFSRYYLYNDFLNLFAKNPVASSGSISATITPVLL